MLTISNFNMAYANAIMVDYSKRLTKEMKITKNKKIKQMNLNFL